MKVVAVIPVFGRGPLVKLTIQRLLQKNGCSDVVCVGHDKVDQKICVDAGAVWVNQSNIPLGRKWNAGFLKAKELNADACLFVGSSDWVSDNWIQTLTPYLNQNGMVGSAGCLFGDFRQQGIRMVYWPGYAKGMKNVKRSESRANEPIGIGRILSSELLNKLNWKPFDDKQDNSLDWSMYVKTLECGFSIKNVDTALIATKIYALSISTDQWVNKHKFDSHWNNELPSHKYSNPVIFLNDSFPEYKELKKSLSIKTILR